MRQSATGVSEDVPEIESCPVGTRCPVVCESIFMVGYCFVAAAVAMVIVDSVIVVEVGLVLVEGHSCMTQKYIVR
jgi:hypothetical protein